MSECPDCDYETDVPLEFWGHWREIHQPLPHKACMKVLNEAADRVIEEMRVDDQYDLDVINGGQKKCGRGGPGGIGDLLLMVMSCE